MAISWEVNCFISDYPLRKVRGKKQLEPVETILVKRSTATIDT